MEYRSLDEIGRALAIGYAADFLPCRQHGHRGKLLTRATVRRRRIEAIECGTWRSGRMSGAARLETSG